jgi:hypothetical protein
MWLTRCHGPLGNSMERQDVATPLRRVRRVRQVRQQRRSTSYRGEQAKLGNAGVAAATRKCTHHADFKSLQFFFAPAHRSGADTHTAHGTDEALAQNFSGKDSGAFSKVRSAGIKNDVANPRARRNGLSGDHDDLSALWNCL